MFGPSDPKFWKSLLKKATPQKKWFRSKRKRGDNDSAAELARKKRSYRKEYEKRSKKTHSLISGLHRIITIFIIICTVIFGGLYLLTT